MSRRVDGKIMLNCSFQILQQRHLSIYPPTYLPAMISAHLLEVIQSHAESLHGFLLLPTQFRNYKGTGEKQELWH